MTTATTLVLQPDARITCPKCAQEFSLEEGFARNALEGLETASEQALAQLREAERLAADRRAQQRERQQQEAQVRALEEVRRQTAEQAAQSSRLQMEGLQKQFATAQEQLAQLRTEQLQLREERQKLKDEKDSLQLEVRKQVDAQLAQRETLVRAQEQERTALDKAELQKKLDDMAAQMADMQRKREQGSQQLQGEVLELALEEGLRRSFPLDVIEEVKKGQRGGDVIQRVQSRSGAMAGVLLWETKRAANFSPQWIGKLKDDMRGCGADAGVLVTMADAVPRDWAAGTQFGLVDDVWVVSWQLAVQLAEVLRAGLLDVHKQRLASAGKGEKMEAVYDYVTSPQFAQKLKAVMDAFRKMREELEAEKNQTMQRWARREAARSGRPRCSVSVARFRDWRSRICRNWSCRATSQSCGPEKTCMRSSLATWTRGSLPCEPVRQTHAEPVHFPSMVWPNCELGRQIAQTGASIEGSSAMTIAATVASSDASVVINERILNEVMVGSPASSGVSAPTCCNALSVPASGKLPTALICHARPAEPGLGAHGGWLIKQTGALLSVHGPPRQCIASPSKGSRP